MRLRPALLAGLLLVSVPVARAQNGFSEAVTPPPKLSVPYERFRLPNGLDVLLHRDATTPTISVNTWYHVGSAREKPGRTGFAHLFEHLMFEGSGNVPEGAIDTWIEGAGGTTNGSTNNDRTNYYIDAASNALELALYLDADRMAHLMDAMTPAKLDGQRDVVKNERRQSYENQPYGLAFPILAQYLYPADHPYHWPVIGSMEDLSAAAPEDVAEFFRTYYTPNNASLVVAGDIDLQEARRLVEKWYSTIPKGPAVPPQPVAMPELTADTRLVLEDRVQLPRLYMTWLSPAMYAPADAAAQALARVLAGGKNSRLYKRLVYDMQIAQDVSAFQDGNLLGGAFYVIATARPGHTLAEIETVVNEEIARLQNEAPEARELERVVNQTESGFLDALEGVGGFGGKADQLNAYLTYVGTPDYFEEDLSRFRALSVRDVQDAAMTILRPDARVVLSVVPQGQAAQAVPGSIPAQNKY
jgi:zinc protease